MRINFISRCFCGFIIFILFTFSLSGCSINNLPEGEFLESHHSPNERYILNIYLVDGGATVDYAIRGELTNTDTGESKNIYWNSHENSATVVWEDDDTVTINGHTLNLPDDTYDFRYH